MTIHRWYAPAYKADNGNVIICGQETVIEDFAREDARRINDEWQRSANSPRVFVAFTDRADWQPLENVNEAS